MRAIVAAVLVLLAGAPAPRPNQPIPREPDRVAHALTSTTRSLDRLVAGWTNGNRARGAPPLALTLTALYQQRIYRLLVRDETLARRTLPRLAPPLRQAARDNVIAGRELARLTRPHPVPPGFRAGRPLPASVLLDDYRAAERRFHVRWDILAAVNFVESRFGRVRSASSAGAQGPMQFLPSTWRRYGLGGNVHDPHDAILGAANYLHAAGAPDYSRALAAYNHSPLYVDAVLRYSRQMRRDIRAYYAYHAWQVFVRTPSGDRRMTGPGLPRG